MSKYPPPYPTTAPDRPPPQAPPVPPGYPVHTAEPLDATTSVPLYLPVEWPPEALAPVLDSCTPNWGVNGTPFVLAGSHLSGVTTIVWLKSDGTTVFQTQTTGFTIVDDSTIDSNYPSSGTLNGKVAVQDGQGDQSNAVPGYSAGS
jgi:hypothetical protein